MYISSEFNWLGGGAKIVLWKQSPNDVVKLVDFFQGVCTFNQPSLDACYLRIGDRESRLG